MPHDMNKKLVKVGDQVLIPCVVTQVSEGEEYCNATVETLAPMHPSDRPSCFSINTQQLIVKE